MIRCNRLIAVSVVLLAPLVFWMARAQQAATPQPDEAAAVPIFQANASLVLLDVVVRDKGKPVEGLPEADFRVFQDGKPQNITAFEEHRASDVQESAKAPVLPPHVYGDFPHYRITSAANVLLLDALNTPQNDQLYARSQLLKYLRAIPPGSQIAVFTLGSRLRMISGFTTDVPNIEQALALEHTPAAKEVNGKSTSTAADKMIDAQMVAGVPEEQQASMQQEVDGFVRDQRVFQEEQRTDITLAAFSELARYLSTVPGRKNLIWVSGGLSKALDPDLSRMNANQAARFGSATRSVNAELSRARVAVYPVDARSLMDLPDSNAANVLPPTEHTGITADLLAARSEGMDNDVRTPQQWAESQQEMKLVAADTGGQAFYNTNAVGKAVEQAIEDGENYYTLGYAPPGASNDGAYHTIAVRTDERYQLQYRRGYYAVDANKPGQSMPMLSPMLEAVEYGVPSLSQVIFEARVLPAGDPELNGLSPSPGVAGKPPAPLIPPVTRYFVDYAIDPHELAMKDLPDGRRRAELEVTQVVYSPQGRRLNNTDAGLQVTLTAAQAARPLDRGGVRVRQEIDVPAGPVRLELGVRDATTGRIGTLDLALNGK